MSSYKKLKKHQLFRGIIKNGHEGPIYPTIPREEANVLTSIIYHLLSTGNILKQN